MKITKIKLNSHLHFKKSLEIDLTYPVGHEKAGQPLEKVCFLGQSGTGKTTLLNLVKYFVCENLAFNRTGIDDAAFVENGIEFFYKVDGKIYSKKSVGDRQFTHAKWDNGTAETIEDVQAFKGVLDYALRESKPLLINFPFCVVNPDDIISNDKLGVLNTKTGDLEPSSVEDKKIWDFDSSSIKLVWNIVFGRLEHYWKEYQVRQRNCFKGIHSDETEANRLMAEFKAWEQSCPNPLQKLADKCLNEILNHFDLEVEQDLDKCLTDALLDRKKTRVIIKKKGSDQEIQYPFLSTGTKQIMLTAIPLFYLEPKNSVILFDQPETSVYPNIQCLLPDVYLRCVANETSENQFFFATHSPVVASAFDPWEVVELRFNENGEVERKEYFRGGERKLDNYYIIPKKLRWDSIYQMLFSLKTEGNEERTDALLELSMLEAEIQRTENQAARNELYEKYKKLASDLDWNVALK